MPKQQPQRQEPEPPAYVDEDHQRIAEFAEDYVPEEDREAFMEHHMGQLGYSRVSGWGPRQEHAPDPEPDPEPQPQRRPRQPRSGGAYFKR